MTFCISTFFNSDPGGEGLNILGGTAYLTNTIIANREGIFASEGTTVTGDYNLFANTSIYGNVVTGSHSLTVYDAGFCDPEHDDYHLCAGSVAIDAGTDAGITTDLDGTPRPYPAGGGFDIGAYEAAPDLAIVKSVSASTVEPGQRLTYTLAFANSSAYTTTSVNITDSVPMESPFRRDLHSQPGHHADR